LIEALGAMSHYFDLFGIYRQIFRLNHLAHGSKQYAKQHRLEKGELDDQSDWSIYIHHLRNILSSDLIELAAKVRIGQDAMIASLGIDKVRVMDTDARIGVSIGAVISGGFDLTLRESCNKIIHAKKFDIHIARGRSTSHNFCYNFWDGNCTIEGSRQNNAWSLKLDVSNWCDAMDAFTILMSEYVDF